MLHSSSEARHRALTVRPIYALLLEFNRTRHTVFTVLKKRGIFMCVYLCSLWYWSFKPPSSLCHYSVSAFILFFHSSLFFLAPVHPPSPSLPNSPSVQRKGSGSQHWLDFHTIPSTECHIKLIRVNNCGSALLSRAPISLTWPGSGHTDGLVISDLGAERMDEGRGKCGHYGWAIVG